MNNVIENYPEFYISPPPEKVVPVPSLAERISSVSDELVKEGYEKVGDNIFEKKVDGKTIRVTLTASGEKITETITLGHAPSSSKRSESPLVKKINRVESTLRSIREGKVQASAEVQRQLRNQKTVLEAQLKKEKSVLIEQKETIASSVTSSLPSVVPSGNVTESVGGKVPLFVEIPMEGTVGQVYTFDKGVTTNVGSTNLQEYMIKPNVQTMTVQQQEQAMLKGYSPTQVIMQRTSLLSESRTPTQVDIINTVPSMSSRVASALPLVQLERAQSYLAQKSRESGFDPLSRSFSGGVVDAAKVVGIEVVSGSIAYVQTGYSVFSDPLGTGKGVVSFMSRAVNEPLVLVREEGSRFLSSPGRFVGEFVGGAKAFGVVSRVSNPFIRGVVERSPKFTSVNIREGSFKYLSSEVFTPIERRAGFVGEFGGVKGDVPFVSDSSLVVRLKSLSNVTGKDYVAQYDLFGGVKISEPKVLGELYKAGFEIVEQRKSSVAVQGLDTEFGRIISKVESPTGQAKLFEDVIVGFDPVVSPAVTISPNVMLSKSRFTNIFSEYKIVDFVSPERSSFMETPGVQSSLIPKESSFKPRSRRDTLKELFGQDSFVSKPKEILVDNSALFVEENVVGSDLSFVDVSVKPRVVLEQRRFVSDTSFDSEFGMGVKPFGVEHVPLTFVREPVVGVGSSVRDLRIIDRASDINARLKSLSMAGLDTELLRNQQFDSSVGVVQSFNFRLNIGLRQQNVQENVQEVMVRQDVISSQRIIQTPVSDLITTVVSGFEPSSSITPVSDTVERVPLTFVRVPDGSIVPERFFKPSEKKRGLRKVLEVRKRGRFVPVAFSEDVGFLTEKGVDVLKGTARASFRIKDISGSIVELQMPQGFVKSKKERGVVVQPREQRIKSMGEKQEITFQGLRMKSLRRR